MVTKELLKTWKTANDSIVVRIRDDHAELTFHSVVKTDGFKEGGRVHETFNSFPADLPTGFTKAFTSESIYFDGTSGNFAALRMLLRVGDELRFRISDNSNGYLKAAVIPSANLNKDGLTGHPTYYGIHNDTLYVNIIRKGKTILRDFALDSHQVPDNSARMLTA